MPKIELETALDVPAVPARTAASAIMHEIAEKRGDWEEFALYLNLGAIGLPDVGYVAIPVKIEHLEERLEPRHEIRFSMHAVRRPEAFPVFNGAVGVDASGPSSGLFWLAGDYELPGSTLGAFFNKVLAAGAAEKTLRNMLTEIAGAIEARVNKKELAGARYRVLFGAGD